MDKFIKQDIIRALSSQKALDAKNAGTFSGFIVDLCNNLAVSYNLTEEQDKNLRKYIDNLVFNIK